ncbi:MAG: molybdate ABC transporter substrate-binding protein [Almyronema sp.]
MKRRQFLPPFLAGLAACLVTVACSQTQLSSSATSPTPAVTLTVSAAASLQAVLEAIAPDFNAAHPQISVNYNFGASGALQQQIEQGAPVDVFFSAASKQMDALAAKGLIVAASRRDLVTNTLVLIAPQNSALAIADLSQLKTIPLTRFAVGEFRSVPAGQYAQQVFETLGLLAALDSKFVFGNNVRSVLAAVESGNAELGMVYATDAALSDQVKVLATAPADAHDPIVYPIAIIHTSDQTEAAQTFIDFLTTEVAQATFAEFGFGRL